MNVYHMNHSMRMIYRSLNPLLMMFYVQRFGVGAAFTFQTNICCESFGWNQKYLVEIVTALLYRYCQWILAKLRKIATFAFEIALNWVGIGDSCSFHFVLSGGKFPLHKSIDETLGRNFTVNDLLPKTLNDGKL